MFIAMGTSQKVEHPYVNGLSAHPMDIGGGGVPPKFNNFFVALNLFDWPMIERVMKVWKSLI
jgi:hypothetical protein